MFPRDVLEREVIYNLIKNKGEFRLKNVLGSLLREHPDWRQHIPALREELERIAREYARFTLDELERLAAEKHVRIEEKPREKALPRVPPPPPGRQFTVRFPPEPSKHLHIGHALSALINSLYAEAYHGRFILRYEDTNPEKAAGEYVESIREDVKDYLQISVSSESYASDHMHEFYRAAEDLILQGKAYVCTCTREEMQANRREGRACAHREQSVEENLSLWQAMHTHLEPGSAVLRFKGDMQSKNMALRDPVLMRISTTPHYKHGSAYRVWPLYDFENTLMDAWEGVTHIFRSNEFGTMRIELQQALREALGIQEHPHVYQYGRFEIIGSDTQGRIIREKIREGVYHGWDDPRLVTLKTLKRRGILPAALRDLAREVGLSKSVTRLDWDMISAYNRKHADSSAHRYTGFLTEEVVEIQIEGVSEVEEVRLPLHPTKPEEGERVRIVTNGRVLIRKDDQRGMIRLMDFATIRRRENTVYELVSREILPEDKRAKRIITWLPASEDQLVKARIMLPTAEEKEIIIEKSVLTEREGAIIQLERYAFARIDRKDPLILWYSHP